MKEGIIRRKFNDAVKEQSATLSGKNTLRIAGALREVTLLLRAEGFDAAMTTRHGFAGYDKNFEEGDEPDNIAFNGEITLGCETLPFILTGEGYEGSDMRLRISRGQSDILDITSTWNEDDEKWEDHFEDEERDIYDDDDSPKRRKAPTLEGRVADALIDVLAKIDFAQRHTVSGEDGLEKTFKVPAQIKINKGAP